MLSQWRMRRSREEAMEDEQSPPASVDPEIEVEVCGEYGSKEAQEGEVGVVRCQG